MGLTITRADARLGMETTPGKFNMESRRASLELHQQQARVNINTELPKVLIEQYQCFAEAGLKNSTDLLKEQSEMAYQQAIEFIGKTAEDGDQLAKIELGGNPIADMAERDAFPEKEFGLAFIPVSSPKFDVTGSLDIEAERNWESVTNGVEINYLPAQLDIDYTPASLRIYMQSYGSLNISYQGRNVDTYI